MSLNSLLNWPFLLAMDFLITTTITHFFPRSCWNSAFRTRYKQKRPNFYSKTKAEVCIPLVLAKGIVGLQRRRHNDGDSNENVAKCQKKQRAGLDWKTTALHVHYTFLYTSPPSLHHYDVKMPNFTFCGGHEHKTTTFFFCLEQYKPRVHIRLLEPTPGKFSNI